MKTTYLELLEKEELQLMQTLSKNRNSQRNIYVQEWEEKHNIYIGNKVCFIDYGNLITGILTGFEFDGCKIKYPIVNRLKKDELMGIYTSKIYERSMNSLKKC